MHARATNTSLFFLNIRFHNSSGKLNSRYINCANSLKYIISNPLNVRFFLLSHNIWINKHLISIKVKSYSNKFISLTVPICEYTS